MSTDRRDIYRVVPERDEGLAVSMVAGEVNAPAEEIVDITLHGAGTRFALPDAPNLSDGDHVILVFTSPRLEAPVEVEATVTGRQEHAELRHFSFRFEQTEGLERELPAEFYRLFNRRGAYRAAQFEDPVELGMRSDAQSAQDTRARLKNISATGLGAIAEPAAEESLGEAESVELALKLPGRDRTLRIHAWIRNREHLDDRVYYGLMFDAARTDHFLEMREEIVDYVLCRFQEQYEAAEDT